MVRYGRKDAERCGRRLAKAVGKQFGNCMKRKNGLVWEKDCWRVSYNPIYGGAVIEETYYDPYKKEVTSGVTQPFGMMRRKPREFCDAVDMAVKAVDMAWKQKSNNRK